ncbi:MAG: aminotransferase class IV [Deltaproteobacteria bacterium]|nr:aminotransferase class IV [Deltaproteobacteria bacterium]
MSTRVNIDGEVFGPSDARISVFDRGFLYGDSVYEVLRTYGGVPFAKQAHLARLQRSADRLGIPVPGISWIQAQMDRTLAEASNPESYIRIVITRGSGPLTLDPTRARSPVCVILVKPYEPFPEWMYETGIRVAIPAVRRNLRAALDPAIKSGNYLNSILALGEARRAGFDDALLLDVRGRIAEASSSNVFVLIGSRLCTPALETGLLEGVTRGLTLRIARDAGMECCECNLDTADLINADEVMITSTLREIMPVVQIDDQPIGHGKPGPVYHKLRSLFREHALAATRAEARLGGKGDES